MAKSTKPTVRIHDVALDEIIDREMNDDEFVQYQADKEKAEQVKAEAQAKEAARQSILNRLGISAEELKTILG